jgi:protein-disulfide isomerase
MRNILIVAGGVVAVAAIAAGAYFGTRPATTGTAPVAAVATPDSSALAAVQPGDHVLGDPKAPVTIIEYASLTCSHCAHFHAQILPDLKKKWIDTGKVKLVYRDFPLDQVAVKAAQIAECAGKDKYFGVLDIIFRSQPQWATGADPLAELAKPLRIAGLGEAEIKACLANDAMMAPVLNDYRSGEALGVSATPTLFIGGQLYRGSRSVEDIDGAISKVIK